VDGFARWVMRKKAYAGVLRVSGDYLMLITLRSSDEVVDASKLSGPAGRAPTEREIAMARTLIESMEGKLDMAEFKDTYRERVLDLVRAKAEGRVIKFPRAKAKPSADTSLESLLRRSIGGRKSA
jgi:DNA end-binding protein Ku